jgi:hypothetical protein
MTRITHKLKSAVSRRMTDEVGTQIKTRITIFTQPEFMFATLRAALFNGKRNAGFVVHGRRSRRRRRRRRRRHMMMECEGRYQRKSVKTFQFT